MEVDEPSKDMVGGDRDFTPSRVVAADRAGRLLTKVELARFLGVTCRTIEEYQRRGLPFFRMSARRNRYDLAAVRDWLNRQCLVVRIR